MLFAPKEIYSLNSTNMGVQYRHLIPDLNAWAGPA